MKPDPPTVDPDTSVGAVVHEWFLRRGIRAIPVCEDGRLVGIVSITDVKEVPPERWEGTRVRQIMSREPLHRVSRSDDLAEAVRLMNDNEINQVLVTRDGELEGILERSHVLRYLQGVKELGLVPESVREPVRMDQARLG